MRYLLIIPIIIFSSCSPEIRTISVKIDEIEKETENICVWRTYAFDRKADTLRYIKTDTLPCQVEYVTTHKIKL